MPDRVQSPLEPEAPTEPEQLRSAHKRRPQAGETPGQPSTFRGCPFFLSERQREVLSLAALGYTDRAIARRLGKSRRTVGAQLQAARECLGARNTTHAVVIALCMGLITIDVLIPNTRQVVK